MSRSNESGVCLAEPDRAGESQVAGYDSGLRGSDRGALKHLLDQVYYPCLAVTVGRPYEVYSTATPTPRALRAVHSIAGGMGREQVAPDVSVTGGPSRDDLSACEELGALVGFAVAG